MNNNHETTINGVDVGKLVTTVDAIKAEPNLSDFKFAPRRNGRAVDRAVQRSRNFMAWVERIPVVVSPL